MGSSDVEACGEPAVTLGSVAGASLGVGSPCTSAEGGGEGGEGAGSEGIGDGTSVCGQPS